MRAVLATAVVLLAPLGACGSDRDSPAGASDGSTTVTTSAGPMTSVGLGESSTTQAGPPAGSVHPGGPGTTGSSSTTAGAPPVIEVGSLNVGELAPALLRPGRGNRVVLEVRAQEGAVPANETIGHIADVLGSASGKQVVVDGPDQIGGGERRWTQRDIITSASRAAESESGQTEVVLRLLFLRGTYEGNTGVLGVAVAGDVAAVFSDQVDSAAGLLVSSAVVEDAVAMHEVGHLLGLVDLILGTGRGDPDHPGHSRNKRSVMYWQVESDLITQLLDGGIPRDFDADDRDELAQIRAG